MDRGASPEPGMLQITYLNVCQLEKRFYLYWFHLEEIISDEEAESWEPR